CSAPATRRPTGSGPSSTGASWWTLPDAWRWTWPGSTAPSTAGSWHRSGQAPAGDDQLPLSALRTRPDGHPQLPGGLVHGDQGQWRTNWNPRYVQGRG